MLERKKKGVEAKPCLIYGESVKTETVPVEAHEVQTEIASERNCSLRTVKSTESKRKRR